MRVEESDVLALTPSVVHDHQVPLGVLLERKREPDSGVIVNRHLLIQLMGGDQEESSPFALPPIAETLC
jgi:hypothetical protein